MTQPQRDVRGVGRRFLRRGAEGVSTVRRTVARRRSLMVYFAIIGPGVITACAGNDAGGIATFASIGASYGYRLLWLLIPLSRPRLPRWRFFRLLVPLSRPRLLHTWPLY